MWQALGKAGGKLPRQATGKCTQTLIYRAYIVGSVHAKAGFQSCHELPQRLGNPIGITGQPRCHDTLRLALLLIQHVAYEVRWPQHKRPDRNRSR